MSRPENLVAEELYVSLVIEAPVNKLWSLVGKFDGLTAINSDFVPEMEDGAHPKQLGAVRRISVKGKEGMLREYLVALNEDDRFPSYSWGFHMPRPGEKSLLPLPRYDTINTVTLRPVTISSPSSTLIEATSRFSAEPQHVAELKTHTEGFFVWFFGQVKERCREQK